jgi:hypothetical protein
MLQRNVLAEIRTRGSVFMVFCSDGLIEVSLGLWSGDSFNYDGWFGMVSAIIACSCWHVGNDDSSQGASKCFDHISGVVGICSYEGFKRVFVVRWDCRSSIFVCVLLAIMLTVFWYL